jgi:SAM-dependent methyltransferase
MVNDDKLSNKWEQAVLWLRDQPDKQQLIFDCYYDDPLVAAAQRYYESDEWQAVRKILHNQSGLALDIGAGRGITSYALAKEGFSVTAVEPNPSQLVGREAIRSLANETLLDIHICSEFSERLPFENNYFDVVFARAVLHHTNDLNATCKEILRVIKPGGIFLAIREHVITNHSDLPVFFNNHPLHHLYGGEYAYLVNEYRSNLISAGFLNVKTISPWSSPINFAPYTLEGVQNALATKLGPFKSILLFVFKLPILWACFCKLLNVIDNRPGRLFSFIAIKSPR